MSEPIQNQHEGMAKRLLIHTKRLLIHTTVDSDIRSRADEDARGVFASLEEADKREHDSCERAAFARTEHAAQ